MGMIPSCHIYHSLLLDFINFPVVLALIKLRPNHSTVSDSCTLFIWKFICFIRPSNKSISRRHPLSVIMFMLDWKGMYFIGVRFLCRFFFFFFGGNVIRLWFWWSRKWKKSRKPQQKPNTGQNEDDRGIAKMRRR